MKVFGFTIAVALLAQSAAAQVKFYERGKPGQTVNLRHEIIDISMNADKEELVRAFLKENSDHFSQIADQKSDIALKKEVSDHLGASLRYEQKVNGVLVEGAELIALYDRVGQLRTVNSSLKPVPAGFNVTPAISQEEAVNAAAEALEISLPSVGDKELRVVERNGEFFLVWHLAILSPNYDQRSSVIQIVANGPKVRSVHYRKGLIHKTHGHEGHLHAEEPEAPQTKVSIIDAIEVPKGKFPSQETPGKTVIFDDNILVKEDELHEDSKKAYDNLKRALLYYETMFGRKSFDDKATSVPAFVRLQSLEGNAAWIGNGFNVFVFGTDHKTMLRNLPGALDVVGHEITHGVISHTSNLLYEKQSGALNEHLADVFGELIEMAFEMTGGKFLIGEHTMSHMGRGKALRDMRYPKRGLKPQPGHIKDIPDMFNEKCEPTKDNDNCGVHILSGIPNKAAARIIRKLGPSTSAQLFYRVMTNRLTANANFVDYKNQMMDECEENLPEACKEIERSFSYVGL